MKSIGTLTLWATVVHRCLGFGVTGSNDANVLANALFSGPGITIVQASFTGAASSSGTFIDGPFGIGSGAILTSGSAVGALPNGDHYVNNGQPGSDTYCNVNTFNAAILTVDVVVGVGYNGIDFEYIMASEEEGGSADPIGIFVGGTQYATDQNGNRITATSPWLAQPLVIVPPNSVTSYPGSSPPFLRSVLVTGAQTIVIAICDQGDAEWDSGLLIKAGGCTDCDTDFRLAYVTSTITTTTTGTSTQTASGTVSGTIFVSVMAETTTTTAEETTTTVPETTTTTAETTTAEMTTTTAETTTEETTTTTAETTTETTTAETTTTAEMTTTEETTTTAETTTETTTSEELTTTTEEPTTTTEEPTTTAEVTSTAEESSTTLETTTEATTSVGTTSETPIEPTTTETTAESPTTSDETSTEEPTTETTLAQSTETITSLTTQPTTSTESPTTTQSVTSTEPSTTSVELSTSLQSSAMWSTQSSDTTSQISTTSIEPSSITLDSSSIWSSESSYTTTQESTLKSISTQTSSIIFQLSSDESSSTETLSSTNAQLPTVMSVESSTTPPTTSTETSPSTSTQLLPVMSTETSSTTGTEESTSEVIPPESSSLEPSIPTLEHTTSDSMFTVLPTPAPPSESTTSTEPIDASSAETPSPEPSVSETVTTVAPLPPSASAASETSTEAAAASNLPSIEDYEFIGCLGSRQGYPTFEELLTDPEMTTARCIELAAGRKYVGLYFRSCYVADELTDTGLVQNGQCDLPCPGDPGLFCGGNVVNRRRAVSSDRLLTLYALTQALDSSSIEVIPSTSEPLIPSSLAPSLPPTSTLDIVPSFDPSSIDIPSSIPPSEETSANNLPIPFPTQGPSPPKGYTFNVTQTVEATYASTVTTVVYQTINPQDPEYLTVTEVVVTIGYYPCGRCAVQPIPPVEMTTIVQPCKACGWQGANSVTLTIPKAACTPAVGEGDSYQPGAWRRPAPHKAADGVYWSAEAKATEPASRPRPDHGIHPGNQYSPPAGNDRYPAEHDQPRPPVQQRPVATHQTQPAMTKKPAPDASLPPPPPAKAEPVNPEVPADSEPTQPEDYVWDDQDEYDSPQPHAIHTQAAPKPVSGSDNSNLPAENNPWGPPTDSIVVVAKGAVNGINGFMMAALVLLVIFY
ncbi:hypothetical protein NCS55_01397900 [Fusarium keratoplasticum]|nr:hypothetical protein NCS55_01397900 [Fusarium keratoplasticum]